MMPIVGVGTWQTFEYRSGRKTRASPLPPGARALFAAGGKMIDSSPMYGRAEAVVGRSHRRHRARRQGLSSHQGVDDRPRFAASSRCRRSVELFRLSGHRPDADHNLVDWERTCRTCSG